MGQSDFDLGPEQWATLRRLLDEALAREPDARLPWLDTLEGPLAGYRQRLRELLEADPRTANLRMDTLPKVETADFAPAAPDASPERIGPYRLLRELGSGGMASVWLAERTDMLQGRQVALKLPHGEWGGLGARGAGRHAGLAERMAREREILATLTHPNIARLYDAGVAEDGQPYLALEFVEGERVDIYCKRHGLDVPARLRLFLQAARAVAHAHANLVVHRDLKPSNILVNAQGEVRLLDFGIAKLLDQGLAAETELTQASGRALTPDYASPEQIRGDAIGTASDVYSLGVVLYELLTGARPYKLEHASRAALEAAILSAEPKRPSTSVSDPRLQRALRGDLDTIVMRALKKDSAQRYATVAALAEDIERQLDGRVVLAQPDSGAYRLRKFVARNRLAVGAVAGVMVALVAGAGVALWQAQVARAERAAAVAQQARSDAATGFLQSLLQQASPDRPLSATELLDRGTRQLDQATGMDEAVLAFLRYEISTHYLRFNQTDRELALLDKSAEGARRAGDADLEAAARCSAASALAPRDRTAAAARLAEGEDALARVSAPTYDAQADCAIARAGVLEVEGHVEQAIKLLEVRLAMPVPHGRQWAKHSLQRTHLAGLYVRVDRQQDALRLREQGLAEVRRRGQAGTLNEFVGMGNVATSLLSVGEARAALDIYREQVKWFERGVVPVLPVSFFGNLGLMELTAGSPSAALAHARTEHATAVRAGNPPTTAFANWLISRSLLALGRADEAVAPLEAAEAFWRSNPKAFSGWLADAALQRAELHAASGRLPQAVTEVDRVLGSFGYPQVTKGRSLNRALRLSATLALQASDPRTALERVNTSIAIARSFARDERKSADVGSSALLRARAYAALGRPAQALADARLAAESLAHGLGPEHAKSVEAAALLKKLTATPAA
jgi:serine/threonine-protein kinase